MFMTIGDRDISPTGGEYSSPEEPTGRFKTSLCRIDYVGLHVALRNRRTPARRNGNEHFERRRVCASLSDQYFSLKEKTSMTSFAKKTVVAIFATTVLTLSLHALAPSPPGPAFQSVKSIYASKCAVCHGNDGSANTAKGKELKVRNLRSEEFKKMSDAKAMEVLLKGKGKMEGYEKTLGKEKLEQLLAYCRELSNK
jgi:mono/diheme cytochrome c family protein